MTYKKYYFEEWRDIADYEGLYQVSNYGRVKSLDKTVKCKGGCERLTRGKFIKTYLNNKGYFYVCLSKEGKVKKYTVHRLVAVAFIPNPENKPTVDHINCNKSDNVVWNLRWASYKEQQNFNDQDVRERQAKSKSKAVLQINKDTNEVIKEFPSAHQVERETGFFRSTICNCCLGRNKHAYGYMWRYK